MKHIRTIFMSAALAGAMHAAPAQQLNTPAPSPLQTVTQAFGLGEIKIEYSRPSVKGRVIYGGLVPYGQIWRTGANAATKITFGENIQVNGTAVKAGTYALYTIPGKDEWQVMLYNDLKLGGDVANYKPADEALRFTVKPRKTMEKVETFTIGVNNISYAACTIDLVWENTAVSFNVTSGHDAEVMKQIASIMDETTDTRPYYRAAAYYYENDKDLAMALKWIDKAAAQNADAFWITHMKAKIQAKMKDYNGAIETANLSKAKAQEKENADYVALNDKLIAEIRKDSGMK
jgi:hypothetical protein